ncbi:MAG: ATP-binding cassette domain-containing protein [Acidimicrobiales bacterium]
MTTSASTATRPQQTIAPSSDSTVTHPAPRLDVIEISQHSGDRQTLHRVSFAVEPGEVVAIAGGSGAGKTTLLEAMVGVRPADSGWILVDGQETAPDERRFGYVPQDDIIHHELSLRRTLEHAAALRLPATTDRSDAQAAVTRVMDQLDLADRAELAVGSLSGGQRKRASIAVELLTDPHLFFLDEPTSGLDPATGADVMTQLRTLAERGTTVVLTTHAPADLARVDRVVFLARDGHLAFVGTPAEAIDHFGVEDLTQIYEALASEPDPRCWAHRFRQARLRSEPADGPAVAWPRQPRDDRRPQPVGAMRQWSALTRRNLDLLRRSRLTLAILLGSPVLVVGMKAELFGSGGFTPDQPSAMPAVQVLFWVAFSAFFFGVTYGLLQVVGEFAIFQRERFGGLRVGAYVASKITVLLPLLVFVNAVMLVVLQGLDRLPATTPAEGLALLLSLVLASTVALSMGLLASAAVHNPAQATLALPLICFPQVLLAGGVVPTAAMAPFSRAFSVILGTRWGFESMGRILHLDAATSSDPATSGYTASFTGSPVQGWLMMVGLTIVATAATTAVLHRRTR